MPRHVAAITRSTKRVIPLLRATASAGSVGDVALAHDRARHAPRTAPAAAELAAGDAQDFDAGGFKPAVGLSVALVSHAQTRCEREGVVAVVPLLTFGRDRVESGVDYPQRVDAHRLRGGDQEWFRRVDAQPSVVDR